MDPDALTTTAATAMANGLAGLLLAAIAFPVRWLVEWRRQRRQAALTAAREARRELRQAVLESRQTHPWIVKPPAQIDEALARRTVSGALEQVCWILAELPERDLYELVERAAGLYERRGVVRAIYSPPEAEDPGPELLKLVDEALSVRVRQASGGLHQIEGRVTQLEDLIRDAEAEHERQRHVQLAAVPEAEQQEARSVAERGEG